MRDRINEVINVESLVEIYMGSVSGFSEDKAQSELWVSSSYLSNILKNGNIVDIGVAIYSPQNPILEEIR